MDRNPVLVLGSTGFIGRNLVPELLREGFPVRVMVRDTSRMSSMPWGNDVEVFQGDAEKAKSLSDAMQG
ncbi:MAG: NAD(P)H-binding protein, partial [Desulfobacterales bacterium]|nr:NAD(P)H-binding protein [Desulfobacterales bacterium]